MTPVRVRLDAATTAVGAGFFLTGVGSVLLGPLIPELRAAWDVSRAQVAWLFVAQFVGSSAGAVLSSYRLRLSLVGGYALVATGLALLPFAGWPLALPALAVTGFGLGLTISASNLWIAHRHVERRAAALSTLNLIWGLGAASCPVLVASVRVAVPTGAFLTSLASLALAGSVALATTLPADPRPSTRPDGGGRSADSARSGRVPALLIIAAMLFLYVGSENAVGGWLVTLVDERLGTASVLSLWITSGFWAAILVGRAAAPSALRHVGEAALFRLCVALAAGGTAALILVRSEAALLAAALATGLGCAPLFPLSVSILAEATAATRSRETGWVLACGGLGGAALPWLTGQLGAQAAGLRFGFVVPLAGLLALAALHGLRATPAKGSPG